MEVEKAPSESVFGSKTPKTENDSEANSEAKLQSPGRLSQAFNDPEQLPQQEGRHFFNGLERQATSYEILISRYDTAWLRGSQGSLSEELASGRVQ